MTYVSRVLSLAALAFVLSAAVSSVHAQRTSGAVGLGGQVGEPSGVTLKVHNAGAPSYDFLAAWSSVSDFFFLNGHALFEKPLPAENVEQPLEWFIGPGAYVGVFEAGPQDGEAVFGISGTIGVQMVLAEHFELYLQATPRFNLAPETDGDLGGGLGLRYYF
ncbi:hypothetical protein BSZ35_08775 [Salinibacter sp. 10B]|uniref:hypothetical protein n=1 Tax=Salinibacter sp. 10B TaxID=1923971 RepID=UPI000CF54668|nr:hypothetical protein [Salinibacter sp. 10B]PQJ34681.1 hypothetical protein BSZ35_08775 [Salinibacter sp. 10B]